MLGQDEHLLAVEPAGGGPELDIAALSHTELKRHLCDRVLALSEEIPPEALMLLVMAGDSLGTDYFDPISICKALWKQHPSNPAVLWFLHGYAVKPELSDVHSEVRKKLRELGVYFG